MSREFKIHSNLWLFVFRCRFLLCKGLQIYFYILHTFCDRYCILPLLIMSLTSLIISISNLVSLAANSLRDRTSVSSSPVDSSTVTIFSSLTKSVIPLTETAELELYHHIFTQYSNKTMLSLFIVQPSVIYVTR